VAYRKYAIEKCAAHGRSISLCLYICKCAFEEAYRLTMKEWNRDFCWKVYHFLKALSQRDIVNDDERGKVKSVYCDEKRFFTLSSFQRRQSRRISPLGESRAQPSNSRGRSPRMPMVLSLVIAFTTCIPIIRTLRCIHLRNLWTPTIRTSNSFWKNCVSIHILRERHDWWK